jgi:nucleoside-diphosphate-sugar epimerase
MSTAEVYKPQSDPWHVYVESDPLGDSNSLFDPTYSVSKITQEAVARACARAYGVPTVIARMNAAYGSGGGLLGMHLSSLLAGEPVVVKWDPAMYSPIHEDDIAAQAGALLAAASVPATVLNWAGDEAVSAQEWCAYMGRLTGRDVRVVVREVSGGIRGVIVDTSHRLALTGPCQVNWRDGVRRMVDERRAGAEPATPAGATAGHPGDGAGAAQG